MQFTQAKTGRVFLLRLEHNEVLHETIEAFCKGRGIERATVQVLGGANAGSRLVVGPEDGEALPVTPVVHELDQVHEMAGTGTVFPDANGEPMIHLHLACGRSDQTVTGCARAGVLVWRVGEVVVTEMLQARGARLLDSDSGLVLLKLPDSQ